MNLSHIIDVFAESIKVLRRSRGNWSSGGVYEAASPPLALSSDAAVSPVSGRELQVVPEGLRGVENKQFITKAPLYAASRDHDSDVVIHGGAHYRIHTVADWSRAGFWSAIGAREEEDA